MELKANQMLILGEIKNITDTHFKLNKMSEKYGKLVFTGYQCAMMGDEEKGNQIPIINVDVIPEMQQNTDNENEEGRTKIKTIKIPNTVENENILKKYNVLSYIDFEDVLITHYVGEGAFNRKQVMQSLKANKLVSLKNSQPNRKPQQ